MEALMHTQCSTQGLVHGKGTGSGSCSHFMRNISPFHVYQLGKSQWISHMGTRLSLRGGVQSANFVAKEAEAPGAFMCLRHLPPTIPAHGPSQPPCTWKKVTHETSEGQLLLAPRCWPHFSLMLVHVASSLCTGEESIRENICQVCLINCSFGPLFYRRVPLDEPLNVEEATSAGVQSFVREHAK